MKGFRKVVAVDPSVEPITNNVAIDLRLSGGLNDVEPFELGQNTPDLLMIVRHAPGIAGHFECFLWR